MNLEKISKSSLSSLRGGRIMVVLSHHRISYPNGDSARRLDSHSPKLAKSREPDAYDGDLLASSR